MATKAPARGELTAEAFLDLFYTFTRSAFRCEQQPAYLVDEEQESVAAFLAGRRDHRGDEATDEWLQLIRDHTAAGRTVERVRIHDDPPTDYQRWLRWYSQANVRAGEIQHYITRWRAAQLGVLPDDPRRDWWLLDDTQLLVMTFDDEGRCIRRELVTDDDSLAQAREWRHLAVRHAREETTHP